MIEKKEKLFGCLCCGLQPLCLQSSEVQNQPVGALLLWVAVEESGEITTAVGSSGVLTYILLVCLYHCHHFSFSLMYL